MDIREKKDGRLFFFSIFMGQFQMSDCYSPIIPVSMDRKRREFRCFFRKGYRGVRGCICVIYETACALEYGEVIQLCIMGVMFLRIAVKLTYRGIKGRGWVGKGPLVGRPPPLFLLNDFWKRKENQSSKEWFSSYIYSYMYANYATPDSMSFVWKRPLEPR